MKRDEECVATESKLEQLREKREQLERIERLDEVSESLAEMLDEVGEALRINAKAYSFEVERDEKVKELNIEINDLKTRVIARDAEIEVLREQVRKLALAKKRSQKKP